MSTEEVKAKRKPKKSVSYALKALDGHVGVLKAAKLLNAKDAETIGAIVKSAKETYIKQEYGI